VSIDPATGTSLAIGPRDVFLATFWTTAELAVRLRQWQATTFGRVPERWAYVIQDYEPGFYPMSAQSELARATYSQPDPTVAIFNTSLLQEAFHAHGIRFEHEFAFEPRIPEPLRAALAVPAGPRRRTIVVYGRPRTPRNAFPAIVDGLHAWRASDPNAAVDGHLRRRGPSRCRPRRWGGAPVDRQARPRRIRSVLRGSAIGISLMVSPTRATRRSRWRTSGCWC
jgi:hypothetical protein